MAIDTIFIADGVRSRRSLGAMLYRAWLACRAWSVKRRTRHALMDMTEDQLCDIGISRSDARREVSKSFYWD